jgi:hypothetical protein
MRNNKSIIQKNLWNEGKNAIFSFKKQGLDGAF